MGAGLALEPGDVAEVVLALAGARCRLAGPFGGAVWGCAGLVWAGFGG